MITLDNRKINVSDNLRCIKGDHRLGFYEGKTYTISKFQDSILGISGKPYGVWFRNIGFYFTINTRNELDLHIWDYFETIKETRIKKLKKIGKIKDNRRVRQPKRN